MSVALEVGRITRTEGASDIDMRQHHDGVGRHYGRREQPRQLEIPPRSVNIWAPFERRKPGALEGYDMPRAHAPGREWAERTRNAHDTPWLTIDPKTGTDSTARVCSEICFPRQVMLGVSATVAFFS